MPFDTILTQALEAVREAPAVQAVLIALSTLVLEDPTTIGAGLLVADGRLGLMTALAGLIGGIALGDIGLYLLGRLAGRRTVSWGLLSRRRLNQARNWIHNNMLLAVLGSRFVPGMRLATYVGCGAAHVSFWRFGVLVIFASVVWTVMLMLLTLHIGGVALELLGRWRWPAAAVFLALLVAVQFAMLRRLRGHDGDVPGQPPAASAFEFWPPLLFYIPVFLYWAWLALRYRGMTLMTVANPSIYSGGFIRESKTQILDLIPERFAEFVPAYTSFDKRVHGDDPERQTDAALRAMATAGLDFPLVAKPDQGQRGDGVRLIRDRAQLADYIRRFPGDVPIVLQELIDAPHEAGVFYYCRPGSGEPVVDSITLKEFPKIVGDGRSTVRGLIEADPRHCRIAEVYHRRHAARLDDVLAEGETLELVFAGNHCQGAVFRNGARLITPELTAAIHAIASSMDEFYFGRFDVRFHDECLLMQGKGFRIVEVNGASAEATHIWDAGTRLGEAYRALFRQWRMLFEIGAINRRRGHRPMNTFKVLGDLAAYRRLARTYPPTS